MIESNVSFAAAANLTPMVDYADLDGPLLLGKDRFEGVTMFYGRIELRSVDRSRTGAVER